MHRRPRPRAAARTASGTVRITRVHLEEDAAKLLHLGGDGRRAGAERSARRLQPRRHPAGRDRHRAGPALRPEAAAFLRAAAPDAASPRRERRATWRRARCARRQRQRAPAPGRHRAGHQDRAQEHELASASCERGIEAEIARQIAILEAGGRVVQETLHFDPDTGEIHSPAQQGGGARLPLLPGAGPACRSCRPRSGSASCGPACPSCRSTGAGAGCATWGSASRTPRCCPRPRSSRATSRPRPRWPTPRRRPTGSAASCGPSCASGGRSRGRARSRPPGWPSSSR